MTHEILIVDEEPDLRQLIRACLARQGFRVREAGDAVAFERCWADHPADLVLIDINMPGEDGLTLTRRLHERQDEVGIILVTAVDTPASRIEGLLSGADDYVAKPFQPCELLARIRSVLRRVDAARARAAASRPPISLHFGPRRLDLDARRLLASDGVVVPLTAMEFDLVATFARHKGQPLSRDRLAERAHHRPAAPGDRSIDTRITGLRQQLAQAGVTAEIVRTVKGDGYVYDA